MKRVKFNLVMPLLNNEVKESKDYIYNDGYEVESYDELIQLTAKLSYANGDFVLFY